ncbi:MAG: helix-turn-helix domain-containing protein [Proteobacteria bacterium]|nr:helix-turn-helix domain-containing protein [Pseudomonadota bacterium]
MINVELVNEHAAAKLLGMSVCTLRAWRLKCTGPVYCKLGRSIRYKVADLQEFIEQGRVEAA